MRKLTIQKNELCAICLFVLIIIETAFENTPLQIYSTIYNRMFFLIEMIVFLVFLTMEKYPKKMIFLLTVLFLISFSSYVLLNTTIILKMFILAFVVAKIGISKSFEILFKFKTIVLFFIVSIALIGLIPNDYEQVEKGIGVVYGYGLGYTHPNRLASSICSLILCYIGWKNDKLNWFNIFMIGIITALGFKITQSRTLLYCIAIFIFCYVLYKNKYTQRIIKRIISLFGLFSMPISVAISVLFPIMLLHSSGTIRNIIYYINWMFSRRFTHIEHMFMAYPITLTGGVFDTKLLDSMFGYSTVDNGYIKFLYQYGVIGLILFVGISLVAYMKMDEKNYIWQVIFIIIAVEGMLENIYIDMGLNLIVIFWSEILLAKERRRKIIDTKKDTLYMARKK